MTSFRDIPPVDSVLQWPEFRDCNLPLLTEAVRESLRRLRGLLRSEGLNRPMREWIVRETELIYAQALTPSLKPVINASGIILHTNLGRSPIDPELFEEAKRIATGYCNLEYDLDEGRRGDRYEHTSTALRELLGCEEALVVNNNAAAVFLILNTFAREREVVVSRGELVEIGGSFRIPEVMAASGAKLVEVGTTNRTRIGDYEAAIGEETTMLMKVHRSNYSIEGFSAEAKMEEISVLAKERGLIDYYDLGSGYFPELPWGLGRGEPSLEKILRNPPSLLSFSGDKLFGSVQAGIILGKKELIDRLKRNQILRMFRVDKITLALLERTVLAYRKKEYGKIPVFRMLFASVEQLKERATALKERLPISSEVLASDAYVGGGTLPNRKIPTVVLALKGDPEKLEAAFRKRRIIGRIEKERFILDMRTVEERDFEQIVEAAENLVRSEE